MPIPIRSTLNLAEKGSESDKVSCIKNKLKIREHKKFNKISFLSFCIWYRLHGTKTYVNVNAKYAIHEETHNQFRFFPIVDFALQTG